MALYSALPAETARLDEKIQACRRKNWKLLGMLAPPPEPYRHPAMGMSHSERQYAEGMRGGLLELALGAGLVPTKRITLDEMRVRWPSDDVR